jgi:hypothetical protein
MEREVGEHRELPAIWCAAMRMLSDELSRIMWNATQLEYPTPFSNNGTRFECPTFVVEAYSWDESRDQPWNFRWRDVEIICQKHCFGGVASDRDHSPARCSEMLDDCLAALRAIEDARDAGS